MIKKVYVVLSASTISLTPSIEAILTTESFGNIIEASLLLAVHSFPPTITWPVSCRLWIGVVTTACWPIRLSRLVFSRSLLKCFTASGLVKHKRINETTRKVITCKYVLPFKISTINAIKAPPVNQMVVSPSVAASIRIVITKTMIHRIIIWLT